MTKTCNKCGEEKPLEDFYRASNVKSGRTGICKACKRASRKVSGRDKRKARTWVENNPVKSQLYYYRANANRKGREFELTLKDFEDLQARQCSYCGSNESLGFDRVDSSIGYVRGNVTPCCTICNQSKSNRTREQFITMCERVTKYQNG